MTDWLTKKRLSLSAQPSSSKRRRYSCEEKARALDALKEPGANLVSVANVFGIPPSTLQAWKKDEAQIMKQLLAGKSGRLTKAIKANPLPCLTKVLLEWVRHAIATSQVGLSIKTIEIQAKKFRGDLLNSSEVQLEKPEREALVKFTASASWVRKFIDRSNLRSVTLHGEAGAVDHKAIEDGISKLKTMIEKYDDDCVYNMDETGLPLRIISGIEMENTRKC